MRRWPSRYPRNGKPHLTKTLFDLIKQNFITGVVNLSYKLPKFPSEGKWVIRVEAMSQVHDYTIYVERYYVTFFEVPIDALIYKFSTNISPLLNGS